MNLFSRTVVVLLCLALAAAAIGVIALAWTAPDQSIARLADAVDWLSRHNQNAEKTILSVVAGAIAFVALTVVLLELLPDSGSAVKVTDVRAGDAQLSTADIAQRVEEAVREVDHVAQVKAYVRARRKGVAVSMDLHVDPDANLAQVTDAACQAARDTLANKVHVAVAQPPLARLHYRELRLRARDAAKDAATATGVTEPQPESDVEPAPEVEQEPHAALMKVVSEAPPDGSPAVEEAPAIHLDPPRVPLLAGPASEAQESPTA